MANKNISIVLIAIAIIAIVLVAVVAVKNNDQIRSEQAAPVVKNQPPANNAVEQPVASQPAADSDVDSIESDLNSISDDSFGEDTLSDTEVGL